MALICTGYLLHPLCKFPDVIGLYYNCDINPANEGKVKLVYELGRHSTGRLDSRLPSSTSDFWGRR